MSEEEFIKIIEPLIEKKEYKKALKIAEKEAKKNPENLFAWYAIGVCFLNMQKFDKALDAFTTFTDNKRANQSWGHRYLADSFVGLKKFDKAVEHYKKSLEHNPKYRYALFGLESSYRKLNDLDNAIKTNLTITQLYPREKKPWYWLSVIYLVKEELANAYSYVLRAIRNASEDKEVLDLYKEIEDRYDEIAKTGVKISALKEIEFGNRGYGTLDLSDREIKSLTEVEFLEITKLNLFRLKLNHNEIKEISGLDDYPELAYLEINDNQISSLSGLGNLPDLQSLKLEGNEIQKMSNLEKLIGLRSLHLGDNQIENIEGLLDLNLLILDLSNNQIKKIEGLEQQQKLTRLDLSGNQITEISGLKYQYVLKDLDLSNNQITSLKGCYDIRQVQFLNLSNNNLTTLENIEILKDLKILNLEGNPNLPEFFAIHYNNEKEIASLHQFSSLSNEELKKKSDEILELRKQKQEHKKKVEKERKERKAIEKEMRIEREAFFGGSLITSTYGGKHNLKERLQTLQKIDEEGTCLYCKTKVPDNGNCVEYCASTINQLVKATNKTLPGSAKDRDNYVERKVTDEVTNRRNDIYDAPGSTFVTRIVKDYKDTAVGKFSPDHFPKLIGTVCKNCSDNFIKKTSRHFKRLQRRGYKQKHFADKIRQSMSKCHEDYLKTLESMITKRGF